MRHAAAVTTMAAVLAAGTCGAVDLYVSTGGNDAWSGRLAEADAGRQDGPFASLLRARDEIRVLRSRGPVAEPVTVTIGGGVYAWREPLVLGPQDSGSAAAPVLYRARPGETVILRGSVAVNGWQPWRMASSGPTYPG